MKLKMYVPAFTGIRAIAAFCVFLHHYNQTCYPYPLFRIFNDLHIGVSMLFVLSGFLICHRYYETSSISSEWYSQYLKNRLARVYPMYFLLTVLTFFVAAIANNTEVYKQLTPHWLIIVLNLTFLRGFFNDIKFTGLAQGWSMTVEETFYLLAPFFFLCLKKRSGAIWQLPLTILLLGAIAIGAFKSVTWWGFLQNGQFVFIYTFFGRCIDFFIGIFLALYMRNTVATKRFFPLFTIMGILLMACGVAVMASVTLPKGIHYGLYHPIGTLANNILLPVGAGLFFYGLLQESSIIRQLLASGLMQKLGKISYCFYLIHIGWLASIVCSVVNGGMEQMVDWLDDHEYWQLKSVLDHLTINIMIVFVVLNTIAYLLWRYIEEPLHQYIKKSRFFVSN